MKVIYIPNDYRMLKDALANTKTFNSLKELYEYKANEYKDYITESDLYIKYAYYDERRVKWEGKYYILGHRHHLYAKHFIGSHPQRMGDVVFKK